MTLHEEIRKRKKCSTKYELHEKRYKRPNFVSSKFEWHIKTKRRMKLTIPILPAVLCYAVLIRKKVLIRNIFISLLVYKEDDAKDVLEGRSYQRKYGRGTKAFRSHDFWLHGNFASVPGSDCRAYFSVQYYTLCAVSI